MPSTTGLSTQTERELREVAVPLSAIKESRSADAKTVLRLRQDTIKMTDDREVGRWRGSNTRLVRASEVPVVPPTEIAWLADRGDLSNSFGYSRPENQERAAHMVQYVQDDGFALFGEPYDITWFIDGWEARINHRARLTDERIILMPGFTDLEHGAITETIFFIRATVAQYKAWLENKVLRA